MPPSRRCFAQPGGGYRPGMSDEQDDPRPYDPEELDDEPDGIESDPAQNDSRGDESAEDDELPDELPRAMPPGSAAELDEEPERRDPEQEEP